MKTNTAKNHLKIVLNFLERNGYLTDQSFKWREAMILNIFLTQFESHIKENCGYADDDSLEQHNHSCFFKYKDGVYQFTRFITSMRKTDFLIQKITDQNAIVQTLRLGIGVMSIGNIDVKVDDKYGSVLFVFE